jgi:hypothetical protein
MQRGAPERAVEGGQGRGRLRTAGFLAIVFLAGAFLAAGFLAAGFLAGGMSVLWVVKVGTGEAAASA